MLAIEFKGHVKVHRLRLICLINIISGIVIDFAAKYRYISCWGVCFERPCHLFCGAYHPPSEETAGCVTVVGYYCGRGLALCLQRASAGCLALMSEYYNSEACPVVVCQLLTVDEKLDTGPIE